MPLAHLDRFLIFFAVGLGLFLAGGVNVCLRRRSATARGVATALVLAAVVAGFAWLREDPTSSFQLALLLAAGLGPCLLLSSPSAYALCGRLGAWLARPGVCWLILGVCGLVTLSASVGLFENEEDRALTVFLEDFERNTYRPPLVPAGVRATTDRGTVVLLRASAAPRSGPDAEGQERSFLGKSPYRDQLIRRAAADDYANCHGWVFTGGRYWVPPEFVDQILEDNAYRPVTAPRPGDLVIYRDHNGPSHTAVVRYVARGMPVLVEGKWGPFGVYLHPVEQSGYGTNFTYYRSRRTGHLLHGVLDEPDGRPAASVE